MLSDSSPTSRRRILNSRAVSAIFPDMKTTLLISVVMLGVALAAQAAAQCYADYKAKQDNPLRLQYGVIELPADACGSREAAASHAAPILARSGWTLLQIESIFGASEFQRRSANAGAIHLRE